MSKLNPIIPINNPLLICKFKKLLDRDFFIFCTGTEEFRTRFAGDCVIDSACPVGCSCDGTIVDCSGRGLTEVPKDIPMYTTDLLLNDNEITKIKSDGLFGRLPNLVKLDMRRNKISGIEQNAFEGAEKLSEL